MDRKRLTINHIDISYLENHTGKAEHTLLFVHGNSMSAALFEPLLRNPVLSNFRMIALDLPGHGESGRTVYPNKDYRFNALKTSIAAFTEKLGLGELVLAGHSLGGHLSIQSLPLLQEKVKGLIIFGTPPLRSLAEGTEAFLPSVAMQYAYAGELSTEELNQFARAFGGDKHLDAIKAAVEKCDTLFRPILGDSLMTDSFADEQDIISRFKPKTLVFHGENDDLINLDFLNKLNPGWLYQSNVQIIPGAGHMSFMDNPEYFAQTVIEYLAYLRQ